MAKVQEMLGPEGVIALMAAMVVAGAREWRRVQTAREKRRVREQELLAEMVSDVSGGSRDVRVRHDGNAGAWSLMSSGPTAEWKVPAGREAAADSRTVSAGRRR